MEAPKDIFYPVTTLLNFGKPFAMSPYANKQIQNLEKLELGFGSIILTSVISIVMLTSYSALLVLEESEPSKGHQLHAIVNGFRVTGAALTVILMFHKQNDLVECLRNVQSFDKKMTILRHPPSYVTHNILLIPVCILIILSQICTASLYWFSVQSIPLAICHFLSHGYQYVIIGIVVFYLDYFCFIFARKLKFIASTTKQLTRTGQKSSELLVIISEMYGDIYQAVRHFNRLVSVPVLVLTIGDILGGMITLYLMYHGQDKIIDRVYLGLYAVQLMCALLPPMTMKKPAKEITTILADCEMCYSDKNLAKSRDTLLYQILQQNINLTVCGLFPMSMSALPEQVGLCISLIFLLNQIVQ